jgi:hypothetical protein
VDGRAKKSRTAIALQSGRKLRQIDTFIVSSPLVVPIADLERLSRSIRWLERYAIAKHPNTPISIVRQLALDANRVVRATARNRLEVDDPIA